MKKLQAYKNDHFYKADGTKISDMKAVMAGTPIKQEWIGEREYLTYVSDIELDTNSCVGTFVLRYDVLERIEYSAPSGRLPEEWTQCAVLVENCVPKEEG